MALDTASALPPGHRYRHLGVVGRFKPLHLGGARMLDAMCESAEQVTIGIGSSNKHNARNPFTAQETRGMLEAYLSPRHGNYRIIEIPDFAHEERYSDGKRWRDHVISEYGDLDGFVTGNGFVKGLLESRYAIIDPPSLIPQERWVRLRSTEVRLRMAQGSDWQRLVPEEIASYITAHGLDDRFRREFGLQTLAMTLDYTKDESAQEEHAHAQEG